MDIAALLEQVFRQTCVLGRGATSLTSDGSRLEVIEMDDKRPTSSAQVVARTRPASSAAPPIVSSKSQLIVHCDASSAGHSNGLQTAATSRDVMMFDVV